MHFLELGSCELYDNVGEEAERDTVGDGVEERHTHNGEEAGERDFEVTPVNVLERGAHHNADDNQHGRGRRGGNKTEQRREHQRKREAKTGDGGGQTGSAACRDTGGRFNISSDGRGTKHSACGGRNGVGEHRSLDFGKIAVLIEIACLVGGADEGADGVKHIDHQQGDEHSDDRSDRRGEQLGEADKALAEHREVHLRYPTGGSGDAHRNIKRELANIADNGGDDHADKNRTGHLLDNQDRHNDQSHKSENNGRLRKAGKVNRSRSALVLTDHDTGVGEADQRDKQADTGGDSLFEAERDRLHDRLSGARNGEQNEEHAADKHRCQRRVGRKAEADAECVGEYRVESQAGRLCHRIVGQPADQPCAECGADTGSGKHRAVRHGALIACRRKRRVALTDHGGVQKDDVRHG